MFKTFYKAQGASLAATVVDYGVTAALVELFGVWYVAATAIGALTGAVTNFLINRHWSFKVAHLDLHRQAVKYVVVSVGSLGLNTLLVYLLTDRMGFMYLVSKVIASLLVGFFYNFPLHRWFVFR